MSVDETTQIDLSGIGGGVVELTPRVSGRISIELTPEEMDDVRQIAQARNQSYEDGRTADTNYTGSGGEDLHIQGVVAEYAMSLLYDECEVDRSISETGDDGIDTEIEISGETYSADIKSSSYENAWLLVKQGYDHEEADIYITSYVDGSYVEIVGFAWAEDLLREENLEESPSPHSSHKNYTMREGFKSMPKPDLNDERVDF